MRPPGRHQQSRTRETLKVRLKSPDDPSNSRRESIQCGTREISGLEQAIRQVCRGRLLDLGCGKVPLYGTYREHVSEVICADWPGSPHATLHLDIACDISQGLPFAGASFDTVLLTDVLEHLPTPEIAMREIARVLAPRGVLLATVPFMYWIHEEPNDHYRYTEFALRRLGAGAGLIVERLEPYGGALDVVIDTLAKSVADLHWRIGPFMSKVAQRIGVWLRRGSVGRLMRERWRQLPIGYLLVLRKP